MLTKEGLVTTRRSSDALSTQVGIALKIIDWKPIEWQPGDRAEVLKQVVHAADHYDKPYDIVLAFPELMRYALVGGWEGVIDDTYRRFIIIRRMTVQVLLHEICHSFLFSANHSWGHTELHLKAHRGGFDAPTRAYLVSTSRRATRRQQGWGEEGDLVSDTSCSLLPSTQCPA